jgi:hypothetical protein
VQNADGTYTGDLSANQPWTGGGNATFQGNLATPQTSSLARPASAFAVNSPLPGVLTIKDMKLQTTTTDSCINANAPPQINFGNLNFGARAEHQILAQSSGANVTSISNYTISGGTATHCVATSGAQITDQGRTITITGSPSQLFAYASRTGNKVVNVNTFSGTATGFRYAADMNGTNNPEATYLPGSVAEAAATGGQYF